MRKIGTRVLIRARQSSVGVKRCRVRVSEGALAPQEMARRRRVEVAEAAKRGNATQPATSRCQRKQTPSACDITCVAFGTPAQVPKCRPEPGAMRKYSVAVVVRAVRENVRAAPARARPAVRAYPRVMHAAPACRRRERMRRRMLVERVPVRCEAIRQRATQR